MKEELIKAVAEDYADTKAEVEKKEKKAPKPCTTCKFIKAMPDKNPCTHCHSRSKWKPMTEKQSVIRKANDSLVEKLVDEKLAKKTKKKNERKEK